MTEKDQTNSKIIELLIELGKTYLERGDYGQAIEKFKTAIDLGANDAKVFLNLSKAYILKEQFDQEAQRVFEKSLEFEPENAVLNVILSQIYLKIDRRDDLAMRVFLTALKYNPNNADQIRLTLIKNSFEKGNIELARELMGQFQSDPDQAGQLLPFYIALEWKHQGFDRVTHYLKQLIKVQTNDAFYRWLLINFLQAQRQTSEHFQLSIEDLKLCLEFLERLPSLDRLVDIYLYPAIKQMLAEQSTKLAVPQPRPIDEFEIFLSENALNTIWEKGLNREESPQLPNLSTIGEIWNKMTPWDGASVLASLPGNQLELMHHEASVLQVLKLTDIPPQQVNQRLSETLNSISQTSNSFLGGFAAQDGYILFWKEPLSPVKLAVNFVQEIDSLSATETLQGQIQCLIHSRTAQQSKDRSSLVREIQLALAPLQLERELFAMTNHTNMKPDHPRIQILITSPLKEKLDQQANYQLEPITLPITESFDGTPLQVFELRWNDSFAKIRQGKIQQIGRFKLLNELNHNPVFLCFKAADVLLDRLVVLKLLNSEYNRNSQQEETLALFLSQAKALGKIAHPKIAMIYDIGLDQNFCFLAREYVEGIPLGVQRSMNKKINIRRTLEICLQICQALQFVHQKGVAHGRLQPNNIFLIGGDEIKITDFQLPSLARPLVDYAMSSLQSASYGAPEQIDSIGFDALCDVFSFGVIMYELFTNQHPFYDPDQSKTLERIRNIDPQPPSEINADLSPELDAIIFKAIEKAPQHRYQTMAAIEQELSKLLSSFRSN
ncbi:MAG: protein kinase [candidate division KSB1 bacterium]|nr:protein kinase [candidate division KSB1 bacterium]